MKKIWIIVLSFLLFLPGMTLAEERRELLIGLIPEMNVFTQMERYKPLAHYLSKRIGVPVRLKVLSRYGNIIHSFNADRMDGAFFGSFTGAMAIQKLGVVPVVRPVNLDGDSTYSGLIFVRKDSGIRNVAHMKGRRIAFVEKATTAGYVFPLAYLKKSGVAHPETFFSECYFSGSHDASVYAVLNRKADIGVAKSSVYEWLRQVDPRIDRELVVLTKSSKVPSNGLLLRKTMDEGTKRKIKAALLYLDKTKEGMEVLEKLKALRFVPAGVRDYESVVKISRDAGIDLRTYDYVNE